MSIPAGRLAPLGRGLRTLLYRVPASFGAARPDVVIKVNQLRSDVDAGAQAERELALTTTLVRAVGGMQVEMADLILPVDHPAPEGAPTPVPSVLERPCTAEQAKEGVSLYKAAITAAQAVLQWKEKCGGATKVTRAEVREVLEAGIAEVRAAAAEDAWSTEALAQVEKATRAPKDPCEKCRKKFPHCETCTCAPDQVGGKDAAAGPGVVPGGADESPVEDPAPVAVGGATGGSRAAPGVDPSPVEPVAADQQASVGGATEAPRVARGGAREVGGGTDDRGAPSPGGSGQGPLGFATEEATTGPVVTAPRDAARQAPARGGKEQQPRPEDGTEVSGSGSRRAPGEPGYGDTNRPGRPERQGEVTVAPGDPADPGGITDPTPRATGDPPDPAGSNRRNGQHSPASANADPRRREVGKK